MTDVVAQMLDELMGKNRNLAPDEQTEFRFDDETVCKHFLCGFCPNELFTNTKVDMGICRKVHDEKYREQYKKDPKFGKLGYEDDFESILMRLHNDMGRKIKKNNERLELTQPDGEANNIRKDRTIIKLNELEKKINECLMKAEQMGAAGNVKEAEEHSRQADQHRIEKASAEKVLQSILNEEGAGPNGKSMEVCQICGCFLIAGDAQVRVDEHLLGKLHAGFAKIKVTLEEIEAQRVAKRKEREAQRGSRGPRDSERDKDRKSSRHRSRSRDRDRKTDKDRDRFTRRRSGSRSRDGRSVRDKDSRGGRRSDRESRDDRKRDRSRDRHRDRDSKRSRHDDSRDRSSRRATESSKSSSSRDHKSSSSRKSSDRKRSRSRSPRPGDDTRPAVTDVKPDVKPDVTKTESTDERVDDNADEATNGGITSNASEQNGKQDSSSLSPNRDRERSKAPSPEPLPPSDPVASGDEDNDKSDD